MTKLPHQNDSSPSQHQPWEGSSSFINQGTHWSSALIWLSSGLLTAAVLVASIARIDQTISVRGQLEPSSATTPVDSPSAGIVDSLYVRDGDTVSAGQTLLAIQSAALTTKHKSINSSIQILNTYATSLSAIIDNGNYSAPLPPDTQSVNDNVLQSQLRNARNSTLQVRSRLNQISNQLKSRTESLRLKKSLAADYRRLYEQQAISRHQYLTELDSVQNMEAQVYALTEERTRVLGEASNQLSATTQQILSLKAELASLDEALASRIVKSPISGTVFNLQVASSSVVTTDQVLLTIVPQGPLQAAVNIPNSDIGFIRTGLPASISVDSFNAGEFGYIKGTLSFIGSDALDKGGAIANTFPATISLQEQSVVSGPNRLNLQSGMSITANIKLRSRPAITLITDIFTKQFDGIKQFR